MSFSLTLLPGLKMGNLIALSFDDGYIEYAKAAHLLSRLGIKVTFYLTTHIKQWEKRQLLAKKPDLIVKIADLGHEIGSHTCTHKDLRKCDKETLIYELKISKNFLEDLLGREVLGLAYPWGFYNHRVLNVVREYYIYARTTEFNLNNANLLNSPPRGRYELGALAGLAIKDCGFQKMLSNIIKVKHKHLIIYTHVVQPIKLTSIIKIGRILNAKFVTVHELFNHLAKEYGL